MNTPRIAITTAAPTICRKKLSDHRLIVIPMYVPSMKNEPWARLVIFMRPKTSERPAASTNSNMPNESPLIAWTIKKFTSYLVQ